jgi:hypothetical protein
MTILKYKFYCINLIEREDRYIFMKDQFTKYGMDVKFIRNNKHKLGGKRGCFESHIQCIKDAFDNNLDYCLIFEDDSLIYSDYKIGLDIATKYIKKNDAEIIYLQNRGLVNLTEKIKNNLYYGKSLNASCILITKKFMKVILKTYKKYINMHYDSYLCIISKKPIVCLKYIVTSSPFGSDNSPWSSTNLLIKFQQQMTNYSSISEECCQLISQFIGLTVLATGSSKLKTKYINTSENMLKKIIS